MDKNLFENNGTDPEHASPKAPQTNIFEDVLFSIIAGLALVCWDITTRRLLFGTYTRVTTYGDGEYRQGNLLNITLGVLISLLAGIGVGYNMGWVGEAPLGQWVSYSLLATAGTAVYGWTILYMVGFQHAFRLSAKLWSHVNIGASSRYAPGIYAEDEAGNPAWFSKLLIFAGIAVIVVASLFVVHGVACHVQSHQDTWGWLGRISIWVVAIAVVAAYFTIVGSLTSGSFAFWLLVTLCIVATIFWSPWEAINSGYKSLTADNAWGAWGYVPGTAVGIIAGLMVGGSTGALVWFLRMRLFAAVSGIAATYAVAPYSDALITTIPLGHFGFIAPVLPWLAYGFELLVFSGFAFPILHIAITHSVKVFSKIADLWDDVYLEQHGGYREFFLQILNIGATALVIWFGPSLAAGWLGYTSLWADFALTGAAALFTYVVVGKVLDCTGKWPVVIAIACYAGTTSFAWYAALFTATGSAGIGVFVAGFLATIAIGFPAPYAMVRWILDRPWLAGAVRDPLVNAHKRVCRGFADLVDELFEAAAETYGDKTPFREVAIHLTNIFLALAILGGIIWAGGMLGVAAWLTNLSAVLLALTSYSIIGKALLRWGMAPVGFVVAAALGVVFGVFVHGAMPVTWAGYRYIGSVPGGIFGSAVVFGIGFPCVYLFGRCLINLTQPEKWLRPLLIGMHERYTNRFLRFRTKFIVKYRLLQEHLAQARQRFAEKYAHLQQRLSSRSKH